MYYINKFFKFFYCYLLSIGNQSGYPFKDYFKQVTELDYPYGINII